VGTPGRINDHLRRRSIHLEDTGFLVLDETDRMLDMGFGEQLDTILEYLPQQRQTLMFSATLPKAIVQLSSKYLTNPERVSIGETNVVAVNIKQDIIKIDQDKKYDELLNQLHERQGSVIIFSKTKHGADKMAIKLRRDGFTSEALHGDLRQNKRDRVMKNFRQQNFRILVATDIAARGLDVPHIEHVINYDLPQVAEDYIHRMGRTARAGAQGSALCFISPQDGRKWHAIECLLDPEKAKSSLREKPKGKGRRPSRPMSKGKPYHGRTPKPDSEKKQYSRQKPRVENDNGNKSEGRSEEFKGQPRKPRRDRPAHGKSVEQSGDMPYKKPGAKPYKSGGKNHKPGEKTYKPGEKSHKPAKPGFKSGGKGPKPHGKGNAAGKNRFKHKPKQRAA
jgi:superfamily II DNA/RNA helicase